MNNDWLEDIFKLKTIDLQVKYGKPKDGRSHEQLKRYYRKKLMEKTPAEQSPDELNKLADSFRDAGLDFTADDLRGAKRAGFHVGYIKNAEGAIEYTKPLPHVDFGGHPPVDFPQAVAANIRPTRAKIPQRDHKTIFVFGDAQIDYRRIIDSRTGETEMRPIHDERAIRIAHLLCKDLRPDFIVNVGDTVDLAALSRFDADSDHFHKTLGASFQRAHDMYAQFRADNPQAEIVEVDSNHNTRLRNFVLKRTPQFHDMRQAGSKDQYPVMTYPYLANLGAVGVKWVSGYGEANYVYGRQYDTPPIVFKHGDSSVPGSTAAKESRLHPYNHVVRGHSHRTDRVYTTVRGGQHPGQYLASIVVGTLCKITGDVPAVHSAVDDFNQPVETTMAWQQSVLVIRDYGGQYEFTDVMIQDGKAYHNGKEYDANALHQSN